MYPAGNEIHGQCHSGFNTTRGNTSAVCLSKETYRIMDIVPDPFTPLLAAEVGAGVTKLVPLVPG